MSSIKTNISTPKFNWSVIEDVDAFAFDYKTLKDLELYKYFISKGVSDLVITKIVNHLKECIINGYTLTQLGIELTKIDVPNQIHKLFYKLAFDSLTIEYNVINDNFEMISFMMLINNYRKANANYHYAEVRKTLELMKGYKINEKDKGRLTNEVVDIIAKWGGDNFENDAT